MMHTNLNIVKTNTLLSWASQDSMLQQLWLDGEQIDRIADRLERSRSAILTRAARIGLPRREAPGRKAKNPGAVKKTKALSGIAGKAPRITGFIPTERVRKIVSSNQNQNTKKPVIIYSARMCLCCGSSFPSEGSHNRICSKCKESQRYRNAG